MTLEDNKIQVGNICQTTGTFTNAKDDYNPIDPDDVFLTVLPPDQNEQQYQYGDPNAVIQRTGIGVYEADIPIDQQGQWRFRWWSTGDATASTEVCFRAMGTAT